MNKQIEQLLLSNFLSAYFHQDWECDDDNTELVIARYKRSATLNDVRSLGEAIQDYCQAFDSDRELEEKLFKDLGCCYLPSAQGLSAKAWLEDVANQLLRENLK